MNNPKLSYFEKEDILHFVISGDHEKKSIEIIPNVTAELNGRGELIGVEVARASTFVSDSVLASVARSVGGRAKL